MKQRHWKEPRRLEWVLAALFFLLALLFHGLCLWGSGDNYRMNAVFHAGPAPRHIAWDLGLLCLLFVWRRLPRGAGIYLTASINGRRLNINLRNLFGHLMPAIGALSLLYALVCAAPILKTRLMDRGETLSGPEILSSSQVICHAMGAPDGHDYLNCLEGFEEMYAQGVRVFEVDFRMTANSRKFAERTFQTANPVI